MLNKKYLKHFLVSCFTICIFASIMMLDNVSGGGNVQKAILPFLPAIVSGVSAIGSLFQGASQRRQARELERQNVRPEYNQSPALRQNQMLAQQMYQVGLPDQVYNNQLNQIQQNLSTGLRQLGSRSNSAFNVNSLVRNTNQATSNLNAQDAQARQQNLQNLYNVNNQVANDDRYAFNVNQLQPYQQNVQNIQSTRRAGTQNMFGALNLLGQGAMMGVFNNLGTGQNRNFTLPPAQMQGYGTGYNSGITNPFVV